jgi:hypothetical protein
VISTTRWRPDVTDVGGPPREVGQFCAVAQAVTPLEIAVRGIRPGCLVAGGARAATSYRGRSGISAFE